MAIFSNLIQTRPGSVNEISTGSLLIGVTSITSSATEGRDELVSNQSGGQYRLSAFTTIDTRFPLVASYGNTPAGMVLNWGAGPQAPWSLADITITPSTSPLYNPPMLMVKGDPSSQGVYPLGSNSASFAPNPALLVSGSIVLHNSIRSFNRLEGITHIPGNNALVIGGKPNAAAVSALLNYTYVNTLQNASFFFPFLDVWSNQLNNNLTIFGGGMGAEGLRSGENYRYQKQRGDLSDYEAGAGLNIYGYEPTDRGLPFRPTGGFLYGLRFAMERFFNDPAGIQYGRSFVMRIANPHLEVEGINTNRNPAAVFSSQASLLQYSYWQNQLILGTFERTPFSFDNPNNPIQRPRQRGKTQLVSGDQVEILSALQLGQYSPEPITTSGSIVYAAYRHRFAGSRTPGQQSEVFFDNVQLYATASVLPNFGTNFSYALTVRSASGIYASSAAGPTTWQIGLGLVSGSGGGGASLLPGGNNYDIQYNVTQGGAAPRFGGANEVARTFEYVYDATPDGLFRFNGRMQGGDNSSATGAGSIALGRLVVASGVGSHAEGSGSTAAGAYDHAEGVGTRTSGFGDHAEGYGTLAAGFCSHAEGVETTVSGYYAHAEGNNTVASGQSSHTEGLQTRASGQASHAEGYLTTASGQYSHAEGHSAVASGQMSHAEGWLTVAGAGAAHAEGFLTVASGIGAHAEGTRTLAAGLNSHAEGAFTTASEMGSHAEGYATIAAKEYQHAEGIFNIPSTTALWVLGDGASANARHNLIEGHTGQVRFSGSLFVEPGRGYLPSAQQSTVLTYNPTTGQIQLMNTSSIGVGGGGGGGPQYWIQDGTRLYTSGGFDNVQVTGSLYASGSAHTLVGSTTVSGGLFIQPTFVPTVTYTSGLTNPSILAYNTTTGQVQKTSLTAIGLGPSPPVSSIQFNRNGVFGGTQFFLYSESLNTVFAATQLNIGLSNRVSTGTYGMVMGSGSLASGIGSFAQGFQVTSSGVYSHAQGSASRATGIYSHAEGRQTLASGRYDHAEGWLTTSSADYSHAEGYLTRAAQDYSHAEGFQTLASALGAHAEGRGVTASGAYSHAEGFNAQALDQYSHAEGGATIASGAYAHAEGQGTRALADGAHAEGWFTLASGRYSHAEGRQTTASGQESHAQGRITEAIGSWSFAGGYRTTALGDYQSVLGRYNVPVEDENTVFLIGGGSSAQTKNTLLMQTASMQLTGSLYIQDSTWPISGEVYLPRASQSLMLVYNQSTGQVQLMQTASLIPTERDPIFTARSASLATTGSNIFKDKQTISGAVYIPQPNMPFATQSSLVVYDPSTGQLQLMLTSSLPKDGYWIQNGSTLFTSGGFSNVQITGSLLLSSSQSPLGNVVGGSPRSSTVPGTHQIVGGVAISSSHIDAPALYVYNANTQSRALHVEGGVGFYLAAPTPTVADAHQIEGFLKINTGIKGPGLGFPLSIISASNYQGMRSDLVTRTSIDYDILTGSNNTMHIAPGGLNQATAYFPNNPVYGTTFTLVVDSPGQTTIQTGSITVPGAQPQCRIQSPSSTTFAGATYATQYTVVAAGVYNYMFLNVSSGSVGNAWVLTSKM